MDKQRSNDRLTADHRGGKKPYRAPRLREYGDLRKITMAGKASSRADGTGAPATKR
jgi:hypothetical protein